MDDDADGDGDDNDSLTHRTADILISLKGINKVSVLDGGGGDNGDGDDSSFHHAANLFKLD